MEGTYGALAEVFLGLLERHGDGFWMVVYVSSVAVSVWEVG